MSSDPTEAIRRQQVAEINAEPGSRAALEEKHGQCWNTQELQQEFEVLGFAAPYIAVRKKINSEKGSMQFQHSPRLYYGFTAD